jgi:hypothetical protein
MEFGSGGAVTLRFAIAYVSDDPLRAGETIRFSLLGR